MVWIGEQYNDMRLLDVYIYPDGLDLGFQKTMGECEYDISHGLYVYAMTVSRRLNIFETFPRLLLPTDGG